MKIKAETMSAYLFQICAMTAEIKKETLMKGLGAGDYIRKTLKSETEGGLLMERNTPQGPTVCITYKGYIEALKIPQLGEHYERTSGGRLLRNEPAILRRSLEKSRIIFESIMSGVSVDGIETEYIRIRGKRRNDKSPLGCETGVKGLYISEKGADIFTGEPYEDIIRRYPPKKPSLFTASVIKRYKERKDSFAPTLRINQSRARGHLICETASIACYCMNGRNEQINESVERKLSRYFVSVHNDAYGEDAAERLWQSSPRGDAAIFTESAENIADIFANAKHGHPPLCGIYSHVYIIPPGRDIKCICETDYQKKLCERLYFPEEILEAEGTPFSAFAGGLPSVELVSLDLKNMEQLVCMLDSGQQMHALCRKEDEEAIRLITEKYKDRLTLETV